MSGIFIGVDGSDHSCRALRWAMREAAVRHAPLTVVTVAKELTEPVSVAVTVVRGDPAAELIRQSQDADMLVVGRHGSGGFAKLLLGSVATKVMHHAACPVVTIPAERVPAV
jgi:nucleotide-binding universal stress UspA family protein